MERVLKRHNNWSLWITLCVNFSWNLMTLFASMHLGVTKDLIHDANLIRYFSLLDFTHDEQHCTCNAVFCGLPPGFHINDRRELISEKETHHKEIRNFKYSNQCHKQWRIYPKHFRRCLMLLFHLNSNIDFFIKIYFLSLTKSSEITNNLFALLIMFQDRIIQVWVKNRVHHFRRSELD